MTSRYTELQALGEQFLTSFNNADVDAIMAFFTDNAEYHEVHGKVRRGISEIRKSFEGLFSGQFGKIQFDEDDTFIDASENKVMSSWTLSLDMDGKRVALSGLDLLYFNGDKIVKKLTYGKAKVPLYLDVK